MAKRKKKPGRKQGARTGAKGEILDARPVQPSDTFRFECLRCGVCCRHVKKGVMLESLDMFRIMRLLKRNDRCTEENIGDMILKYAESAFLGDIGYPIFLLNTIGAHDACVFLENGRCSVQDAKPRACRLYPLSAGPKDSGDGFDCFVVSQRKHHFKGSAIRVDDWMNANFSEEDRAFVLFDIRSTAEQALLLRKLRAAGVERNCVLGPIVFFKYCNFDLAEPFMPQFECNMRMLKNVLADMLPDKTIRLGGDAWG
jgi:Fe-S-cluster containining protein